MKSAPGTRIGALGSPGPQGSGSELNNPQWNWPGLIGAQSGCAAREGGGGVPLLSAGRQKASNCRSI